MHVEIFVPHTTKKCARKIALRFMEWEPAYFVLPVILFYVMLVNENHVNAVLGKDYSKICLLTVFMWTEIFLKRTEHPCTFGHSLSQKSTRNYKWVH